MSIKTTVYHRHKHHNSFLSSFTPTEARARARNINSNPILLFFFSQMSHGNENCCLAHPRRLPEFTVCLWPFNIATSCASSLCVRFRSLEIAIDFEGLGKISSLAMFAYREK